MEKLISKNYIFSVQEWMVLAALAGIRKLELLFENPPEMPGDGEVEYLLFGLYQKGFLSWKGDSWELAPEIRQMLQNMKEAERELQVYGRFGEELLLCFLAEQEAVVVEAGGNQKDAVRVHGLSAPELLEELAERGILPAERESMARSSESARNGGFPEGTEFPEGAAGQEGAAPEAAFAEGTLRWLGEYLSGWEKLEKDGRVCEELLPGFLAEKEKISAALVLKDRKRGQESRLAFGLDTGLYDWLVFPGEGHLSAERYTADSLWAFLNGKQEMQERNGGESDDSGRYLYAVSGQIL